MAKRKNNPYNPYEAMGWSSDPLVREIYGEIDDRELDEIAQSIFEIYFGSEADYEEDEDADPMRSFEEPKANNKLTRDEAVEATTLASQIVDWANYAVNYNDYDDPPWEPYGPRAAIEQALDALPDFMKPQAYLRSTEHYDVSADGEDREDWVDELVRFGEDPYIVSINNGGYTGATVAVIAGSADEALETADEWTQTYYWEGDYDAYEKARGSGYGVVHVETLFEAAQRGKNPGIPKALKNKLLK